MDEKQWLAERFQDHRTRLRAVAYRMLGSFPEADDAVQDTWLRLNRARSDDIENLGGWLTTVLARVCLNMLRSRNLHREEPFDTHVPDPVVKLPDRFDPEEAAVLADSVSLALLVVLETLTPVERLAFVLHDMFDLPFDEIAPMVERTEAAARQLASRARRRVRGAEIPESSSDLARQREVVDAFFSAARGGDIGRLVAVLHPDVVLRIDGGAAFPAASMVLRGAGGVARQSNRGLRSLLARTTTRLHPVVVNGAAGMIVTMGGEPATVMGFSIVDGRIFEINSISDPARVAQLTTGLGI